MGSSTIALVVFVVTILFFASNKFPLWACSLGGMVAMTVTGCISSGEALGGFANPNAIIMMSMFIVAAGLNRTQMINKISGLAYKVSGGSLTKGIAGYVIVTFIIAQVVPSASTIFIICYPLAADFCRKMGVSPSKALFSIGITAISSVTALPVGSGATAYLQTNALLEAYGISGYAATMFTGAISRIPMILGVMAFSIFIAPKWAPDRGLDVGMAQAGGQKADEKPPLDPVREVLGYGVFLAVVVGLLLGNKLPFQAWQICLAGALILVFTGVLNEREALGAVLLSPVWLFIGSLGLGQGLVNTGAGDIIASGVMKILGNNPSGFFVGLVFFLASFIFTQFMSNLALYNVIYPIALLTSASMGINPIGIIQLCFIGCFTAYLTPMATIAVPIMMGAGGYDQRDLIKLGWLPALITMCISVPWCMTIFPI